MINWLEKNRGVALSLTILIAIEIFHFSSIPGTIGVDIGAGAWIPRIYHFIVFFLFSFFLFITIKGDKKIKINYLLTTISISIIHAILDEVHQMFVPFRYSSVGDVLTNSLGIFSSILIYLYIDKKNQAHGRKPSPSFLGKI